MRNHLDFGVFGFLLHPSRVAAVIVCLALSSCRTVENPVAKTQVRIAGARTDILLKIYDEKIPHVAFSAVASRGSAANVDYIQRGLAEVAFTQSDIAYLAFTQGTPLNATAHTKLRGLASLSISPLHLVAAPGSGIRAFKDLRGKKIAVGPPGSGSEATARIVLPKMGIPLSDVQLSLMPFSEVPSQLAASSLDAEFFVDIFPSPLANAALSVAGTRLVFAEEPAMSRLREEYPFFRPVIIPIGVYGQGEPIKTIGVDNLLICGADLDDEVVYQMLNIFFASLPEVAKSSPSFRRITFDQALSTPIPLHPGAARFYREQTLFR